jgi:integrase
MGTTQKLGQHLFVRGGIFYGWAYDKAGRQVRFSTGCTDRRAALRALRRRERELQGETRPGAAPDHTVAAALGHLVAFGLSDAAEETRDFYEAKAGTVTRLLGPIQVNDLERDQVEGFIATRLAEKVKAHTIQKELVTLRRALKLAHERGMMQRDPVLVFPKFRAKYQPRERRLTIEEFTRLMAALPVHRRLWVLIACFTGGRRGEINALTWDHVDLAGGWITLPGTKTAKARRRVPIPPALGRALGGMKRLPGRLLAHWRNPNSGLHDACLAAKIDHCSPNDLRRTFTSWLKEEGVDSMVVARMLGHTSSAMVERVYGHLSSDAYQRAAAELPDWDAGGIEGGIVVALPAPIAKAGGEE